MKHENNNLLKIIGSRLNYVGVITCFVIITTYIVVVGQEQKDESTLSINLQETIKNDYLEQRHISAANFEDSTLEKATIEKTENTSVFQKITVPKVLSDVTLEKAMSEHSVNDSVNDASVFALLQNNPTLGKTLNEEIQNDSAIEKLTKEEVEENNELDTLVTNTEADTEDTSQSEPIENEPIIEDTNDSTIENDPALDTSIVTQQPSFPYSEKLPLPYEHQEFLYNLCLDYGLDYVKVLAVMEHESKFDPNAIGATSDFGYFQINSINHQWLSEKLGTPNAPLDPYVNMQWGTFFISDLIGYWEKQGLTGTALEDAVLSSYNKGITGFRRNGKATNYIEKVRESYALIQNEYM